MEVYTQLTAILLSLQAMLGTMQVAQTPVPSAIVATTTPQITMIKKEAPKPLKETAKALAPARKCPVVAADGMARVGREYNKFELVVLNRNCKK